MCDFSSVNPVRSYDTSRENGKTYRGAWTAITLPPIRLWHWGHLNTQTISQLSHLTTGKRTQTYIRLSVTLTLFACKIINLLATCSSLAFATLLITFLSNTGALSASTKNACTSWAVTSGGSNLSVSTISNRGLCREINSRAGRRRSAEPDGSEEVGRRYIRRSAR